MAHLTLLTVILSLSLGYKIFKRHFSPQAKSMLWGFFSLFGFMDVVDTLCPTPYIYCSTFLVMKTLLMCGVVVILQGNVSRLQQCVVNLPVHLHYLIHPKLRLFRRFRFVLLLYLCAPLVVICSFVVISWSAWNVILTALDEFLLLVVCVSLYVLLLPSEITNLSLYQFLDDDNNVVSLLDSSSDSPASPPRDDEREERGEEEQLSSNVVSGGDFVRFEESERRNLIRREINGEKEGDSPYICKETDGLADVEDELHN
jgi:hypothetical protein